jgi:hypothetical protein
MLPGWSGNRGIGAYKFFKSQRVTQSDLAGEVHPFADAFHAAYMIRHDLQDLLQQTIPLRMFTDS